MTATHKFPSQRPSPRISYPSSILLPPPTPTNSVECTSIESVSNAAGLRGIKERPENPPEDEELLERSPLARYEGRKRLRHKSNRGVVKELKELQEARKVSELREQYIRSERERRKQNRKSSKKEGDNSSGGENERLLGDKDAEKCEGSEHPSSDRHHYSSLSDLQVAGSGSGLVGSPTCHVALGMILAVLSGILFTCNNFILLYSRNSPLDAILIRGIIHIGILGLYYRKRVWSEKIVLVILQGAVGAASLSLALYAVTLIPVSDAMTLIFTSPLSTFLISMCIFGERLTFLRGGAIGMILVGIVLVCKPSFLFHDAHGEDSEGNKVLGIILAILSSISAGVLNNINKYCMTVSHGVLVFWVAVFALALALIFENIFPEGCYILTLKADQLSGPQWGALVGMGFSGLAAYLSLTRAIKMISPTIVSSLRSMEILLAFGVEAIINDAMPCAIRLSGACTVCAGILLTALQGWLDRPRNGYESLD